MYAMMTITLIMVLCNERFRKYLVSEKLVSIDDEKPSSKNKSPKTFLYSKTENRKKWRFTYAKAGIVAARV